MIQRSGPQPLDPANPILGVLTMKVYREKYFIAIEMIIKKQKIRHFGEISILGPYFMV
jgi:hypothetical protein